LPERGRGRENWGVEKMMKCFEVRKVGAGAEPKELAEAWMENLKALRKEHPRVFRKVALEVLYYAGGIELTNGLLVLARELIERHKRNKALQSIKIALTYKKYAHFHYGSLVKLYLDGSVTYTPRATIEGYGFVIHNGEEVA